jgi:5-methylcytosine-specific restriction endonuclease McrA
MSMRQCLRKPIPEIMVAAQHMSDAVDAHLDRRRAAADELFRLADCRIVKAWLESVWGKMSVYNTPRRKIFDPPTLPKDLRPRPRDATPEVKGQIHLRDGYDCQFCGIPVVKSKVRKEVREVYPDALRWDGTVATQHAGFECLWAQYDHVLPNSRDGRSHLSNVYLTCAACNYGRSSQLLEEFDLMHPSLNPPRQGTWDGLERFRSDVTPLVAWAETVF